METLIQPPGRFTFSLREFRQYRELFYFFTWRDIRVKYKQTYIGIGWVLLQPLGMVLLLSLIFSRSRAIPTGSISYPVFALSGLICWNFFNGAVSQASESIIRHTHIINKIYFPRLIIPCSSVLVALFDTIAGLVVFLVFCIIYQQPVSWSAFICFPSAIILTALASSSFGIFLSALIVKYRDFRYTVPFLLQVLFFSSQVIYPLALIQPSWVRYLLALNPVNASIELFRQPLTGVSPDYTIILIGFGTTILICLTGFLYFRKTEDYFADLA